MTNLIERLYANTDFSTSLNLAQEAAKEIESLRQQLATVTSERDELKANSRYGY